MGGLAGPIKRPAVIIFLTSFKLRDEDLILLNTYTLATNWFWKIYTMVQHPY